MPARTALSGTLRRMLCHARHWLRLAPVASLAMAAHAQYKDYPQITVAPRLAVSPVLPRWATLDLELRERAEGQTSIDGVAGDGYGYSLSRVRMGLSLRPTRWADLTLQGQRTGSANLPDSKVASGMQDSLDFRQLNLKLHTGSLRVITGRQEIRFGAERLVGAADWNNTGRVFDGFLAHMGTKHTLDVFSASAVVVHPKSLDMHTGGLNFHGVYASINAPRTTVESYFLLKRIRTVKSLSGVNGSQNTATLGTRLSSMLGRQVDFTGEAALQRGSYSTNDIRAGAAYAKLGYRLPTKWSPRLQAEFDYATGNDPARPQTVGTFDQLYPSGHNVFGLVDLFGWQNIQQVRFNVDLKPTRRLSITPQLGHLTVASRFDSVYNNAAGVRFKAPKTGFASRDLGEVLDISGRYALPGDVLLGAGYGHFFPGSLPGSAGNGSAQTVAYLSLTYRATLGSQAARPR